MRSGQAQEANCEFTLETERETPVHPATFVFVLRMLGAEGGVKSTLMAPGGTRGMNEKSNPDERVTKIYKREPAPEVASFAMRVLHGPDRGAAWVLRATEPLRMLVGHGPTCEVRLSDPKISRRHAALEVLGGELHVTDLGSTNGTFVDGVRIADAFLSGGEVLQLGMTPIQVEREEIALSGHSLPPATSFGAILGASVAMRRLYPLCVRLAASDTPLLIEGEAGTGKDLLAESLHRASARRSLPFAIFDCAAAPSSMEVDLFGHELSAFGGPATIRKGLIEQTEGGTLLIDELGDLDSALQAKLFDVVERRELRRCGSDRPMPVNVRIMAATRRDLDREVDGGRFHEALFHRLASGRIELPPLRTRTGDVRVLSAHFCRELGGDPARIPEEVAARWDDGWWPNNVGELRDAVARWLSMGEAGAHPESARRQRAASSGGRFDSLVAEMLTLRLSLAEARQRLLDVFDATYIEQQLRENANHVGRAAAASGIGKRYFQMLRARHRAR